MFLAQCPIVIRNCPVANGRIAHDRSLNASFAPGAGDRVVDEVTNENVYENRIGCDPRFSDASEFDLGVAIE